MNRNFKYEAAPKPEPVYFEQIFAEKPGGGLLVGQSFDIQKSTAVAEDGSGKFVPVKAYRLVSEVKDSDTAIKIAKGSGVQKGDIIATGKKGVACTKVDTETSPDYDVVTVTLGVAIKAGVVLYQAKEASANAAVPFKTPKYVLGTAYEAGTGDQEVRLINGANLRKETANIAVEVVDLMKGIDLV